MNSPSSSAKATAVQVKQVHWHLSYPLDIPSAFLTSITALTYSRHTSLKMTRDSLPTSSSAHCEISVRLQPTDLSSPVPPRRLSMRLNSLIARNTPKPPEAWLTLVCQQTGDRMSYSYSIPLHSFLTQPSTFETLWSHVVEIGSMISEGFTRTHRTRLRMSWPCLPAKASRRT